MVKTQHTFRSKQHNVVTIAQDKIALSPFDDKRYVLENNIDTLPWGHYKLKANNYTESNLMVMKRLITEERLIAKKKLKMCQEVRSKQSNDV